MEKEFRKYLDNIINSTITYSRAGGGAGSIILMDLDKKGVMYTLWIHCTWRIENDKQVIATSADDITPNTGLIAQSAKMFEGRQIVSFELSKFNDLFIEFSDNLYIRIFNFLSHTNTDDYNWDFCIPSENISFEITNHFDIKKGKYYTSK
jgi:hypothetical protein